MIALLATAALGQELPAVDVRTWSLPFDASGTLWTVGSAPIARPRLVGAFSYARDPLVRLGDGEPDRALADVAQLDLLTALGRPPFRVGVDFPLFLASGTVVDAPVGIGDVAVAAKASLLSTDAGGIAVDTRWTLPTSTIGAPLAAGGPTFGAALVADRRFGPASVALNAGGAAGPRVDVGSAELGMIAFARVGIGWAVRDGLGATLDVGGSTSLLSPGAGAVTPVEALIGGWAAVRDDLAIRFGVGRGLTGGIGAPSFRTIGAVDWTPTRRDPDRDVVAHDSCPGEPEDRDGWQDDDGCPEPTAVTLVVLDPDGRRLGAAVEVDGQPADGALQLDAGPAAIGVAAPGYLADLVRIDVPPGPPVELVHTLRRDPALGVLRLVITDPADQPVDAEAQVAGLRPVPLSGGRGEIVLAAGLVDVTISAPGFASTSFPAEVAGAEVVEMYVLVEPEGRPE